MAQKAGYQGIKKLIPPLDITTEGTQFIHVAQSLDDTDNDSLIPLSIGKMLSSQIGLTMDSIAPTEAGDKFSSPYNIGDEFYLSDGKLYKAIKQIAAEDNIIIYPAEGYNAELAGSVSEQLNGKVGWDVAGKSVKKNLFNILVPPLTTTNTTCSITGTVINVVNSSGSNKGASFPVKLPKNTNVIASGEIDYTSGTGGVALQYSDDGTNYSTLDNGSTDNITQDTSFSFLCNTGNHPYYRIRLFSARSTAVAGDVSYDKIMIRDAKIADSTYEPSIYDNTELLSYADNGVLGAKNLLLPTYETITSNGVKFSCDANDIITATRESANASASVYYVPISDEAKGNAIKISGCPASGNNSKYDVRLYNVTTSTPSGSDETDYGNGVTVTIPNDDNSYALRLIYRSAYSDTVIFKPMVTLASEPYSDYANYTPPAQTNRQLTVNKTETTVIGNTEDGATASQYYDAGKYFIKNGQHCRTKTTVNQGADWTLGTNYEVKSIDTVISKFSSTASVYEGASSNVSIDSSKNLVTKIGNAVGLRVRFTVSSDISSMTNIIDLPYHPSSTQFLTIVDSDYVPIKCGFLQTVGNLKGRLGVNSLEAGTYDLIGTYVTDAV